MLMSRSLAQSFHQSLSLTFLANGYGYIPTAACFASMQSNYQAVGC
jgi:hypothetical protein